MKNKRTHLRLPLFIVVTLTIVLFFTNFTTVFATDAMDNTDRDAIIVTSESATSDGSITPRGDLGYYINKTLVETTYKKMVFAKYLTDDWKKTNHYDITEGTSYGFNFGYAYKGATLGISFGRSYSYSSTVYADVTRWSKLAGFADFTIKKYLVKRYTTGGMLVNTYYTYTTITTATYVAAKYQ